MKTREKIGRGGHRLESRPRIMAWQLKALSLMVQAEKLLVKYSTRIALQSDVFITA